MAIAINPHFDPVLGKMRNQDAGGSGQDGFSPYIGENGNWIDKNGDTGVQAAINGSYIEFSSVDASGNYTMAGDTTIPAAVLTNENTASASEIFVGAVQYYEKATIVGTTTFGKGIVQVILPLSDGSGMKITVSNYYTPADVCIHGIGIEPDVEVEYDYNTEEDEQLDKALEVLKAN